MIQYLDVDALAKRWGYTDRNTLFSGFTEASLVTNETARRPWSPGVSRALGMVMCRRLCPYWGQWGWYIDTSTLTSLFKKIEYSFNSNWEMFHWFTQGILCLIKDLTTIVCNLWMKSIPYHSANVSLQMRQIELENIGALDTERIIISWNIYSWLWDPLLREYVYIYMHIYIDVYEYAPWVIIRNVLLWVTAIKNKGHQCSQCPHIVLRTLESKEQSSIVSGSTAITVQFPAHSRWFCT